MRRTLRLFPLILLLLGASLLPGSAAWAGAVSRGDLLLSQHKVASSLDSYRRAGELPGAESVARLRQGRVLAARGEWEAVVGLYGGMANRGLGGPEAMLGLAEAHYRLSDVDAAIPVLRREMETRPSHGAAWALLVEWTATAGMPPGDIRALVAGAPPAGDAAAAQRAAYLEGACLLTPWSEEGRAALGRALAGPDPHVGGRALELLSAAETGDPAERLLAVARILMAQGLTGPSLDAAESAEGDPALAAEAMALRGYGLTRLGRFAEAEELLRRAMELDPQLRLAEFALGSLLRVKGDEEGAAELLVRAARRNPPNPAVYAELANALAALGDFGSAERAMRLAVESSPDDAAVRLALVRFHVDSQYRPFAILEDAREAVRLSGRSAEALSALGWALHLSGQPEEGLEALLEARAKAPRSAPLRYRLGSVHERMGALEDAEREYRMVLELDAAGEVAGRARAALSELDERRTQ
jgi:tetratricopeptide (TPR) repeat protein